MINGKIDGDMLTNNYIYTDKAIESPHPLLYEMVLEILEHLCAADYLPRLGGPESWRVYEFMGSVTSASDE